MGGPDFLSARITLLRKKPLERCRAAKEAGP